MALHWCALINNVAQITEDAQGFFKDQNHTQGQLHKQKMSQDTHHPSSLNFEWGKAFFFFFWSFNICEMYKWAMIGWWSIETFMT